MAALELGVSGLDAGADFVGLFEFSRFLPLFSLGLGHLGISKLALAIDVAIEEPLRQLLELWGFHALEPAQETFDRLDKQPQPVEDHPIRDHVSH